MLYFVRHGESEANVKHVFSGQRDDTPLTDKGREQARLAGEDILSKNIVIDRIISSPLQRAKKTAEIIAQTINFPLENIQIDKRIIEYDMGLLTGTSTLNITSDKVNAAEEAEDLSAFQTRVMEALADAYQLPGNTLLVSHAGIGRVIEGTRIGLDPHKFYDLPPYPNAQVVTLNQ